MLEVKASKSSVLEVVEVDVEVLVVWQLTKITMSNTIFQFFIGMIFYSF